VADPGQLLILSGDGEVIEPDDGVVAIGSGGSYALAAARALIRHTNLTSEEIARTALEIAGDIDIYTNTQIVYYTLSADGPPTTDDGQITDEGRKTEDEGLLNAEFEIRNAE